MRDAAQAFPNVSSPARYSVTSLGRLPCRIVAWKLGVNTRELRGLHLSTETLRRQESWPKARGVASNQCRQTTTMPNGCWHKAVRARLVARPLPMTRFRTNNLTNLCVSFSLLDVQQEIIYLENMKRQKNHLGRVSMEENRSALRHFSLKRQHKSSTHVRQPTRAATSQLSQEPWKNSLPSALSGQYIHWMVFPRLYNITSFYVARVPKLTARERGRKREENGRVRTRKHGQTDGTSDLKPGWSARLWRPRHTEERHERGTMLLDIPAMQHHTRDGCSHPPITIDHDPCISIETKGKRLCAKLERPDVLSWWYECF